MTRFRVPTWATVALAVLAGVLATLNITSFGFVQPWRDFVTFALAVLAAVGIAPLTGPALQTALHISHAAALALASILTAAVALVTTLSISQDAKGVIIGILTLIGGVLFGPAGPSPAPPARP